MLRFLARRHGGLSLLFFTLLLMLVLLPRASLWWTPLERSLGAVLAALQRLTLVVTAPVTMFSRAVTAAGEVQRLRDQVGRLQAEHRALQRQAAEAERLQQLLDLRATLPYAVTAAAVIGRDPNNWHRSLVVAKGGQDGLMPGMAVITREGVVGRVVRVGPRDARVLLVTDQNSAFAAMNERTRDQGIVEGAAGGRLRLKYLLRQADVRVGDLIMTTGLEGIFPRAVVVGRVQRVGRAAGELAHAVEIVPSVDFSRLEIVEVVTGSPVRKAMEELARPGDPPDLGERIEGRGGRRADHQTGDR